MRQTATEDEVRAEVRRILRNLSPVERDSVTGDDQIFDDLGYDSLAIVELAMVLESELGLRPISEDEAMDIVTVGDLEDLVCKMARPSS